MRFISFVLFFSIILALVFGQFKVVNRAWREQKAGIGRFTYAKNDAPIGFWFVLGVESAFLVFAILYLIGTLGVVVQ